MSDSVSIKIRLHNQDAVALGPGKADLLDAIVQHGSISAAGRAMGMSYKRALGSGKYNESELFKTACGDSKRWLTWRWSGSYRVWTIHPDRLS